jgi:hypothetical protein
VGALLTESVIYSSTMYDVLRSILSSDERWWLGRAALSLSHSLCLSLPAGGRRTHGDLDALCARAQRQAETA